MNTGWNENSRTGLKGRANNCGMIAMSNLYLVPDEEDYCNHCGISTPNIIRNIQKQTSTSTWYYGDDKLKSHVTVGQFAKHFPKGLYCVFVKNHVGVVDNGKLLNLDARKKVMYAELVRRPGTKLWVWLLESRFSITEFLGYRVPERFTKIHEWLWLCHSKIKNA